MTWYTSLVGWDIHKALCSIHTYTGELLGHMICAIFLYQDIAKLSSKLHNCSWFSQHLAWSHFMCGKQKGVLLQLSSASPCLTYLHPCLFCHLALLSKISGSNTQQKAEWTRWSLKGEATHHPFFSRTQQSNKLCLDHVLYDIVNLTCQHAVLTYLLWPAAHTATLLSMESDVLFM